MVKKIHFHRPRLRKAGGVWGEISATGLRLVVTEVKAYNEFWRAGRAIARVVALVTSREESPDSVVFGLRASD